MEKVTPKDVFLQSLNRCAKSEQFIPSFYNRFLSSSDEVREKFQHTDFEAQNQMLLRSLRLTTGATAGDPEALRELKVRARTHDRHHLNIEPRLYELWRCAIVETAAEFDEQWCEDVEIAWNSILGHVIGYMVKYY